MGGRRGPRVAPMSDGPGSCRGTRQRAGSSIVLNPPPRLNRRREEIGIIAKQRSRHRERALLTHADAIDADLRRRLDQIAVRKPGRISTPSFNNSGISIRNGENIWPWVTDIVPGRESGHGSAGRPAPSQQRVCPNGRLGGTDMADGYQAAHEPEAVPATRGKAWAWHPPLPLDSVPSSYGPRARWPH